MKIQTSAKHGSFSMRIISLNFLLFVLVHAGFSQERKAINIIENGDKIPVFQITTDTGAELSSNDLQGKITIINFFATWCGPCLKELPHIQNEIWEVYGENENFQLFVVGREHTPAELIKFKAEKEFTFPMVADSNRFIFQQFATQNIPRSYLIDKRGVIIDILEGFDEDDFKQFVNRLHGLLQNE